MASLQSFHDAKSDMALSPALEVLTQKLLVGCEWTLASSCLRLLILRCLGLVSVKIEWSIVSQYRSATSPLSDQPFSRRPKMAVHPWCELWLATIHDTYLVVLSSSQNKLVAISSRVGRFCQGRTNLKNIMYLRDATSNMILSPLVGKPSTKATRPCQIVELLFLLRWKHTQTVI